jgi:hypothetical protein
MSSHALGGEVLPASSARMPRASLRSVLLICAFSTARMCRVSTQITGKSASASALNSHCDSGPASNPIRLKQYAGFLRLAADRRARMIVSIAEPTRELQTPAEARVMRKRTGLAKRAIEAPSVHDCYRVQDVLPNLQTGGRCFASRPRSYSHFVVKRHWFWRVKPGWVRACTQ